MQIYHYQGHFEFGSKCGLSFIPHQDDPSHIYVVLTELAENPGTSITNAYEKIATAIYNDFLIQTPIENINWIEHYTNESYEGESDKWERFDRVLLKWDEKNRCFEVGQPYSESKSWKPCNEETVLYLKQAFGKNNRKTVC